MDVAQAHALEQYEAFHSARLERIRQVEIEEDARQDAALDQAAKAAQAVATKDQGGKTPTPGTRELGMAGASAGVDSGFEEVIALSAQCRYADCSHQLEPGCAVRAALEQGELSRERYSNYFKLKKETEHYELSALDKRKKDKAFGRFMKTSKKLMKD